MRLRLPLYGKILTWFFLNLLVVSAVVAALFTAQFHFNLDWLFSTAGARERLEAVRNLIIGELESTRPDEWEQVISRYNDAYHVHFSLFDDEARPLLGGISELPEEVRKRILERPPFPFFPRRPNSNSPGATPFPGGNPPPEIPPPAPFSSRDASSALPPPPPLANGEVPSGPGVAAGSPSSTSPTSPAPTPRAGEFPRRNWPRPPLRALMRTENPVRYWLLASGRLENPLIGDPMRIVLVARSQTISGGGLILDPRPWLYLGLGIILFSLLFWWPLIASITRTIRRMMQTTRQIADGRFDVRVNLRRRDELGSLSDSIDQMAVRLDGLVSGQKRFLGDIAHELCSPLARLQMSLGILEQRATPEQAAFVQTASEKAGQISSLVAELLSFSKASFGSSAVKLQPVPIRAVIDEAIHRETTETFSDFVVENVPDDLEVTGDCDLLLRAFSNLLRNAVQHAGTAGPIAIRAELPDRNNCNAGTGNADEPAQVTMVVADQGPGVPPDELAKIFDAFYRLDSSRTRATGGTGLGLAIVKTCIESCGGVVNAKPGRPSGLEIHAMLYVHRRAST